MSEWAQDDQLCFAVSVVESWVLNMKKKLIILGKNIYENKSCFWKVQWCIHAWIIKNIG